MSAVLNVVLPVFGIILAGYLAGRFRVLGEASTDALNRFVYFVALPALFFVSMARVELGDAFHGPFLAAFGGGMLGTFGLSVLAASFLFPNRLAALSLHGLSAIFANTGYMGIPLMLTAFGEAGTLPGVIATVLNGAVVLAIGIVLLELDLSQGHGPLRIVGNVAAGVLKSPLLLSAAAGLAVSAAGLSLPKGVVNFADILGAAAAPCALFAMGLFMVGRSVTAGAPELAWMVLLKLLVQPALTWWLAYELLVMEPLWAKSAVILSALPTGALVFVLAQQYQIFVQRSTAAILISTVISVVTLSALFAYLGVG